MRIIHGDTLHDPFKWLENEKDHRVINYLEAENAYFERSFRDSEKFVELLYQELKETKDPTESSIPHYKNGYKYFSVYDSAENFPIEYRQKINAIDAPEELYFNPNELFKGGFANYSLGSISQDNKKLIFTIDKKGNEKPDLYIWDIYEKKVIDDQLEKIRSNLWVDNEHFIYTQFDSLDKSHEIYLHKINTKKSEDKIIYKNDNLDIDVSIKQTTSKKYLMLSLDSLNIETRLFLSPNNIDKLVWKEFDLENSNGHIYVDHSYDDDFFTIFTSDNFFKETFYTELFRSPINQYNLNHTELIASGNDSLRRGNFIRTPNHIIQEYSYGGKNYHQLYNINDKKSKWLDLSSRNHEIVNCNNVISQDSSQVIFSVEPLDDFEYSFKFDVETEEKTILKIHKKNGLNNHKLNPKEYVTKRIYAPSDDSVKIPITICYKRGTPINEQTPWLIGAYAEYGMTYFPYFNTFPFQLLDRGIVVAQIHARGSGFYGRKWYDQGSKYNKKNSAKDLINAVNYLVDQKMTSYDRVILEGTSAGGLLMGMIANMAPTVCKAMIIRVGVLDLLTQLTGKQNNSTISHHTVFGNTFEEKKAFEYVKSYSPYENLKDQSYPTILLLHGYGDTRVSFWNSAKYIANFRYMQNNPNSIYMKTDMNSGHMTGGGNNPRLREAAMKNAFILKTLGKTSDYKSIQGIVRDSNGDPLSYVNIYLDGTNIGTTTNHRGKYNLDLPSGENNLVFKYISFKTKTIPTNKINSKYLDIVLENEDMYLENITVTDEYDDPAYKVIKAAQNVRKKHKKAVKNFSQDIYARTTEGFDTIPEKFPWFFPKNIELDSGFYYLTESISHYTKELPDERKEIMKSSIVAGQAQGYSYNRASDAEINIYDNIFGKQFTGRGLISPISSTAMMYYRYELLGYYEENDVHINKIKVISKRKNDPAVSGIIYIAEDTWNVIAYDFDINPAQLEAFTYDKFNISSSYTNIQDDIWMPENVIFKGVFSIMGFTASYNGFFKYSDIKVNEEIPQGFFHNEMFRIDDGVQKNDTSFWTQNRPIKLTQPEIEYYQYQDSLQTVRNSPAYKDSVQRAQNKFKLKNLIGGYYRGNHKNNTTWSYPSLPELVSFNTVEGFTGALEFTKRKRLKDLWFFDKHELKLGARYGFSNERLNLYGKYTKTFDFINFETVSISAGKDIRQFDGNKPIGKLLNMAYSLIDRKNYMKLYGLEYAQIEYSRELINGVKLSSSISYENRQPLKNTTDFSWKKTKYDENGHPTNAYTSNNPLDPASDSDAFEAHQAAILDIYLRFRIKQKYYTYPSYRMHMQSKYPELFVQYKKGININGDQTDFDYLGLAIQDNISLGMLGDFHWSATYGTFINDNKVSFMDYKHFNGNETFFLESRYDNKGFNGKILSAKFKMLNYYKYSTTNDFYEIHAEHNFGGFILNKIPVLRKIPGNVIVAIDHFNTFGKHHHTELSTGVDFLESLKLFWVNAYSKNEKFQTGFKLGIEL
ncbi:protease II [Aureibacter tunicatorum]|uniref:Protease II n=2 Tax=Aureibacter tunicatorum TaxID=866807 RepID=A0AAE4BUJ7_9BACT|nr:protease II [Aureibacter tunicatorum]